MGCIFNTFIAGLGSHIFRFWGLELIKMFSVKKFRKLLFIKCNNHLGIYDGTFVNIYVYTASKRTRMFVL